MGLSPFSSSCSEPSVETKRIEIICKQERMPMQCPVVQQKLGTPQKTNFTIIRAFDIGMKGVVAEVQYPDCVNFGGRKILVYLDRMQFYAAVHEKELDPHFLERGISPFARFEPTGYGWDKAIEFARKLL